MLEGDAADNLCVRAYELLSLNYVIPPVSMHLHKVIPAGAGLGGGSSDAVHVLRLLNDVFELGISKHILQQYASRLGSDCSFFMHDGPMIGKGKGDVLSTISLNLKGYSLILIKPEVHISTAEAYRGITPRQPHEPLEVVLKSGIRQWRGRLINDFEATVFSKQPEISMIKDRLYENGALYASMSGSGSSVYGIFEQPVDLTQEFKSYFYWSGVLS